MAREYRIDVVVDEHDATEKLKQVAQAEDQVTAAAMKTSDALDRMASSHRTASGDVRGLAQELDHVTISEREADQYLSDLHVTMGQLPSTLGQVRGGLNDVATASGITVGELGLLNSAGLVVGTGIAAWGVGRAIADFFGLDEAIGKATASLVGWGDVAAQAAGAKADVLALASKNAGREITDFGEALRINAEHVRAWSDAVLRATASDRFAQQVRGWRADLESVRSSGVMPALLADLESHNFSLKELAENYRISAGALGLLVRDLKQEGDEQKRAADAGAQRAKALEAEAAAQKKAGDELIKSVEQLAHVEETQRLRVNKEITAEFHKQIEAMTKAQNAVVLDNLGARGRNNAAMGLDLNGDPQRPNDPFKTYDNTMRDIAVKGATGSDVSQLVTEAARVFNEAVLADAKAADAAQVAHTGAAKAADSVSRAHTGAVAAVDSLSGAFASFRGVLAGVPNNGHEPRNQVLSVDPGVGMAFGDNIGMPMGNSAGQVGPLITPAGRQAGVTNHISIDAKGATFEDERALDRLADKMASRLGSRAAQVGALR